MTSVEKYRHLLQDIEQTARKCGRDPGKISVVAVSKGYPWEHVQPAYSAGCRDFGENRIQEALQKIPEAPDDVRWHMIGTLQLNKVKKAVGRFVLIHSVDTPELAQKISHYSQEADVTTHILLQVNTSGERSKHGLSPSEWKGFFSTVLSLPYVSVDGLMTIAPLTDDVEVIRHSFSSLRLFRDDLVSTYRCELPHLSMGMSQDYRLAIAEGATILRIGTVLFA